MMTSKVQYAYRVVMKKGDDRVTFQVAATTYAEAQRKAEALYPEYYVVYVNFV